MAKNQRVSVMSRILKDRLDKQVVVHVDHKDLQKKLGQIESLKLNRDSKTGKFVASMKSSKSAHTATGSALAKRLLNTKS